MNERPLLDWLLTEGREVNDLGLLLRAVSHRLVQIGLPVDRTLFASFVLHPQTAALTACWRADGDEVALEEVPRHFFDEREHEDSPLFEVRRTRRPLRVELRELSTHAYQDLRELIDQGYTDYAAFPVFLGGEPQGGLTFASRAPGGLGAAGFALLGKVIPTLTAVMDRLLRDFIMKRLLMAYLGEDAGARVFHGQVRRGDGQTLRACIWFSDLRGFTALSDSVESAALLDILNDTFDVLVGAIDAEGGQVLKFIGDGLLAVFIDDDAPRACQRGLRGAALREERRGRGGYEPRVGIGLHFGDVTYGNIGAPARLDFTVIGRAVNLASRLEGLCSTLGRSVILSADMAARLPSEECEPLGLRAVKGLATPVAVFGIAGDAA